MVEETSTATAAAPSETSTATAAAPSETSTAAAPSASSAATTAVTLANAVDIQQDLVFKRVPGREHEAQVTLTLRNSSALPVFYRIRKQPRAKIRIQPANQHDGQMGPYSTKNLIINWDYEGVPLSTSPILKLLLELSMSANNFGGENSTKTRIIGRIKPGTFDTGDCPEQLLRSAQSIIPSATAINPSNTSLPISGTRAASTTSNVCKDVRQQQEASGFPVFCLLAVVAVGVLIKVLML